MRSAIPLLCLWAASTASAISFHASPNYLSSPRGTSLESRAKKECSALYTRDPDTCQCYPQYVENGKPKKECLCPDAPNTALVYTQVWCPETQKYNETASCTCRQPGQNFNPATRQCECPSGYKATRNNKNVLTCKKSGKPTTVTITKTSSTTSGPTGGTAPGRRRDLREAIRRREAGQSSDLEGILDCTDSERACKVGASYRCVEIQSSLNSCGACPGEAMDCGSLPNVDEVTCLFGRCTIDTCQPKSLLRQKLGDDHAPFYCDPVKRS